MTGKTKTLAEQKAALPLSELVCAILRNCNFQERDPSAEKGVLSLPKDLQDKQFYRKAHTKPSEEDEFIFKYSGKLIQIAVRDKKQLHWNSWIKELQAQEKNFYKTYRKKLSKTVCAFGPNCPDLPENIRSREEKKGAHGISFLDPDLIEKLRIYSQLRGNSFLPYVISTILGPDTRPENSPRFYCQRLKQNIIDVYLFGATAAEFALFVDVSTLAAIRKKSSYQRYFNEKRLPKIKSFIERPKGFWANTVILGAKKEDINFSRLTLPAGENGDAGNRAVDIGMLSFKNRPGVLNIVDGQHRYFGTLYSNRAKDLELPFVIAVFPDKASEAVAFLKINSKQVQLSKQHLMMLFSDPKIGQESEESERDSKEKLKARSSNWASRILEELNGSAGLLDSLAVGRHLATAGRIRTTSIWTRIASILLRDPDYNNWITTGTDDTYQKAASDFKTYFKVVETLVNWDPKTGLRYSTGIDVLLFFLQQFLRQQYSKLYGVDKCFEGKKLRKLLEHWEDLPWENFNRKAYLGGAGRSLLVKHLIDTVSGKHVSKSKFLHGISH